MYLQKFLLLFSNSLDLNKEKKKENLHLTFSQAFCIEGYRDVSYRIF